MTSGLSNFELSDFVLVEYGNTIPMFCCCDGGLLMRALCGCCRDCIEGFAHKFVIHFCVVDSIEC